MSFRKLDCYKCEETFQIDDSYEGDVYCPYCKKIVVKDIKRDVRGRDHSRGGKGNDCLSCDYG